MAAALMEIRDGEEQLVAFQLAGEIYGINISLIHEIIRMREITHIPRTTKEIEGVINLRGKIVPILDLRSRLGMSPGERTSDTRIIVVEIAHCTVGMIVDGVTGVLSLSEDSVEPPSKLVSDLETDFIRGVGKLNGQLVILLNMQNVIQIPPM